MLDKNHILINNSVILNFVFSEVLKALLKTRDLYERWRLGDEGVEIRSSEEQEWAATELRNSLRSIEWDLEDLDDTVQIVEKNPAKFRIDVNDLTARKNFIKQTKDEVELMKQRSSVQNKVLKSHFTYQDYEGCIYFLKAKVEIPYP